MSAMNSVVAVYNTHAQAEAAIKDLQEAGVDMKSLSIAGRDTHTDEHVVGYYNVGNRMKRWGSLGAFWGGFWDCCLGPECLRYPELVPSSLPARWLPGLLPDLKVRLLWVESAPSVLDFSVLVFPRTASSSTT